VRNFINYFLIGIVEKIGTFKETGNPDVDGNLPFGLLLNFNDDSLRRIVEGSRLKEQTVDIIGNQNPQR
jgi:hypothetical protein